MNTIDFIYNLLIFFVKSTTNKAPKWVLLKYYEFSRSIFYFASLIACLMDANSIHNATNKSIWETPPIPAIIPFIPLVIPLPVTCKIPLKINMPTITGRPILYTIKKRENHLLSSIEKFLANTNNKRNKKVPNTRKCTCT